MTKKSRQRFKYLQNEKSFKVSDSLQKTKTLKMTFFSCSEFAIALRDDTQMTSMKIVQFSRPPTPLVHLHPKLFHPLDVGSPI